MGARGAGPIPVLHVHDRSAWGGNVEHIRLLARGLDRARFRPFIAGPPGSEWCRRIAAEGVTVLPSSIRGKLDFRAAGRLALHCRAHGVRVLHTHIRRADWMGGIATRLARGVAAVATLHGSASVDERGVERFGLSERVYARVLRGLFDAVITVSEALRREAIERLGCDPARVFHVVNGVDLAPFGSLPTRDFARGLLGLGGGEIAIGMVSRFVAHGSVMKGHPEMVRAFARVAGTEPAARLVLVGDGPSRPEIAALARELGVADRVRFLGQRDDVPRLLPAFSVVALPSRGEGLPRALVEAMAAGVPVVGADVGGIPELLRGGAGLTHAPGDTEALAAALLRVLREPGLADSLRAAGRARSAEHSAAAMCRGVEAVYDRVLGRG
ncbi:MAG: glycosyltransferase [Planctomycetales bacterium]|nr:glycosyltransferase [Planctomycetales bacterium]